MLIMVNIESKTNSYVNYTGAELSSHNFLITTHSRPLTTRSTRALAAFDSIRNNSLDTLVFSAFGPFSKLLCGSA